MDENKLFLLRRAFKNIKNQCWIDREGRTYYLNIKEYVLKRNCDISNIVSVHLAISAQISNYKYNEDYYNKLGWIPFGSDFGSVNRLGIEPTQSQINKIYELKENTYELKENTYKLNVIEN